MAQHEEPQAATHGRPENRHLLYIADPLCSWCYGFGPVISQIAERHAGDLPVHVVMGGLRPGETRPSRAKDMDYLRSAWAHVGGLSGRPFNRAFFEREGFVYDTEPGCRAVVTLRHVFPQEALGFLERLSVAFYADNRDMTNPEEIADVAGEAGFNRAEFLAAFHSDEARVGTQRDFALCIEAGIRGFPTLLAGGTGDGYQILTRGYCALEEIEGKLAAWMAR